MSTGSIEVEVESLEILNKAVDLPFLPYSKATTNVSKYTAIGLYMYMCTVD